MSLTADIPRLCNGIQTGRSHRQELRERRVAGCAERSDAVKHTLTEASKTHQRVAGAARLNRIAHTQAVRQVAAQTCAEGRALLRRFADERVARGVPAFLASLQSRRRNAGVEMRRTLAGWCAALRQEGAERRGNWSTARQAAAAAAAADRRQVCEARRLATHAALVRWQEDRTRVRALWLSLGSRTVTKDAATKSLPEAVAHHPSVSLATDRQNLPDTIYILVNSHPEGLAVVDVERILGVPRVVVGQMLRRLVDAGRVRRDRGLYFTDSANQDE